MCRSYIYNIMHADRVVSFAVALHVGGRWLVHAAWWTRPSLHSRGMYVYTHVYADMCKYVCVYACVCACVYM